MQRDLRQPHPHRRHSPTVVLLAAAVAAALTLATGCGKPKSALDQARSAVAADANSAAAQLALGKALYEAKRYNDAFIALNRAHELAPNDAEAAYELARTDLALGDSQHGVPMAKAALQADPRHSRAADILGRFYMRMGRPKDALPYLRQAVEADPANGEALVDLAAVQLALGDTKSALQTSRRSIAVAPKNASAHFLLSELLAKAGDGAGAERELRECIKLDPNAAGAKLRLSIRLIKNPKALEEARALALEAKAINPGDGAAAGMAAEALLRLGKSKEALQEFSVACQANPHNFRLWLLFSRHLREQGLTEEADRAMRYAVQVAPRAPLTPSKRRELNERIRKEQKRREIFPGSAEEVLTDPANGAQGTQTLSGSAAEETRSLNSKRR